MSFHVKGFPSYVDSDNVTVEYTAYSDEEVAPEKCRMAAWANSYPDLESEDSSHEHPSNMYDEVKEDLTLSMQGGTISGTSTLERDVSPPDYRNLTGPLHSAFSGSGEGVTRQGRVENAYDYPPVKFTRAEL